MPLTSSVGLTISFTITSQRFLVFAFNIFLLACRFYCIPHSHRSDSDNITDMISVASTNATAVQQSIQTRVEKKLKDMHTKLKKKIDNLKRLVLGEYPDVTSFIEGVRLPASVDSDPTDLNSERELLQKAVNRNKEILDHEDVLVRDMAEAGVAVESGDVQFKV